MRPNFIDQNPAAAAFDRVAQQREQRRQADETRQRDAAIDSAYGRAATGGGGEAAIREVAAVPGGGRAAFDLRRQHDDAQRQQQQQVEEWEKVALTALRTGDMTTFNHFSRKSGLSIDPNVVNDRGRAALIADGALLGGQLYGNEAQAQRFVHAYTSNGGNLQAAVAASGTPMERPNLTTESVVVNGERLLAILDDQTKQFQGYVQGPDEQPLVVPGGRSAVRLPPNQIDLQRMAYEQVSNQKDHSGFRPLYPTEQARRQAADELVQFWMRSGQVGGPAGAPTPSRSSGPRTMVPGGDFGGAGPVPPPDEPGSQFVGYHQGMPVYERPDGSRFAYDPNG